MHPKKWHAAGFGILALLFFIFLYKDTGVLNRMEDQVDRLVASLPPGERVLATIWAPPDSRLPYIVHMVDRAEWDRVIAINLTGTFLVGKAVLPSMMTQRSGSIINVASIEGIEGTEGGSWQSPYHEKENENPPPCCPSNCEPPPKLNWLLLLPKLNWLLLLFPKPPDAKSCCW